MRLLWLIKDKCSRLYGKLPLGVRKFLYQYSNVIKFTVGLGITLYSYILLFTLPSFVLNINFTVFEWFMILLILVFGVGLALSIRKIKLRAICITMAVCSLALCWYNFATIDNRLGDIAISKPEDFQILNRFDSGNYVLVDDIDFTDCKVKPITNFKGSIDGCGYTIHNLKLDNQSFITTNNGTVTGINLSSLDITANNKNSGFIGTNNGTVTGITVKDFTLNAKKCDNVGFIPKSNKTMTDIRVYNASFNIENCENVGVITGTGFGLSESSASGSIAATGNTNCNVGGLIGFINKNEGAANKCSGNVAISGNLTKSANVGGLIGKSVSNKIFSECYSQGAVALTTSAKQEVVFGGICGEAAAIDLSNSCFSGEITLSGSGKTYAGGLIGNCLSSSDMKIGYSYTSGKMNLITGSAVYGGFVGKCSEIESDSTSAVIQRLINVTDVNVADGSYLKYNHAIGEVAADKFDFISECYMDSDAEVLVDQSLLVGEKSDLMTKTFCVTTLGWSTKIWDFQGGEVSLHSSDNFTPSNPIDVENESDAIYSCKTIDIYPSTLFDEYIEKTVTISGTLNVRRGPGTTYGKLTSLTNGAEVTAVAEQNGWMLVKIDNGYGWVISDYLK